MRLSEATSSHQSGAEDHDPDGEPLLTQNPGANISKPSVDFWRSTDGVNFTAMTAPGATVSVPSISRFDPDTPTNTTA